MLSLVAAISENNVIGKDNKIIWSLPEDLKRFKEITTGHTIIMGRKTFESLGRILPERKHIVLTRDKDYRVRDENVQIVNEISDLDKYIDSDEECFVIGGAIVYRQLLPKVNKMYITRIHSKFEGDSYFPVISENEWNIIEKVQGTKDEKNPYNYDFIIYERKK